MCLCTRRLVSIPEKIGYVLLEEVGGHLISVFYPYIHNNSTRYKMGERYEASGLGFHGFENAEDAVLLSKCLDPRGRFVVLEALFYDVTAIGVELVDSDQCPAFVAQGRTLLKEIRNGLRK